MSLSADTTAVVQASEENADMTNNAESKDEENSKENEKSGERDVEVKEQAPEKKVGFKVEESPRDKEKEKDSKEEGGEKEEEKVEEQERAEDGVAEEEEEKKDDKDNGESEEEQEESENEKPPEPISIDLSVMKGLYKFRDRPTLPYLLTEYGMEDKDAPPLKPRHKKKKKKRTFGDDAARDKERDKQLEQKHLDIVNDMTKLRDYYYEEYSALLQNKVQKQRSEIRHHDLAMKAKLNEKEEKARQDSHHVKRRLDRHEFISDGSFLNDIPKTDLYHIIELQDKLIREGTLKTQSDLNNFWQRIQEPEIFYMYFKVPKSDDPDRKQKEDFNENASSRAYSTVRGSRASSVKSLQMHETSSITLDHKDVPRALSRINESRETSRPGTQLGQHWAITQQFPAQNKAERRRTSFTGLTKPPPQHRSSYLSELEKRFPKLEMPKLHCFTMSLGPKLPDVEEVRHNIRLSNLQKNRKKYTYKLTKMHQMAMTNAAATSRILEMHEDMDFILNGAPLTDLISDHFFYSGLPPCATRAEEPAAEQGPTSSSPLPQQPPQQRLLSCLMEQDEALSVIPSAPGSIKASKDSRPTSSKRSTSRKKTPPVPKPQPPKKIIPLSLEGVVDNSRTVTAKCMSTLWTNYTKDVPPATAAST